MAKRKGGLRHADPDVQEWQREAAENTAALTKKQREDRERTRARYDVPAWLKRGVDRKAKQVSTSASQMGAFLLAWALRELVRGDEEIRDALWRSKEQVNLLQFEYNVEIPRDVEREILGWLEGCDG